MTLLIALTTHNTRKTMQILTATQEVVLGITPKDAKGNPAPVDGTPSWSVSDDTILALEEFADGTAKVSAVGPLGTAQVNVQADADLGEGVVPLVGVMDVTVIAGQAMVITITPGTPTEQVA